jgi:hypothetical protein
MKRRTLADRFEERIKARQTSSSLMFKPTDDAHELAERTAAELMRHAEAFIPDATIRSNMLRDDELIAEWPLERSDGGKALTRLGTHPDASANQVAEMLERLPNNRLALFLAAMVRTGAWPGWQYPSGRPVQWFPMMAKELERFTPSDLNINAPTWDAAMQAAFDESEPEPPPEPYADEPEDSFILDTYGDSTLRARVALALSAYWHCPGKWDPHGVSTLVYIERKVRQAYRSLVRLPSDITTAFTSARAEINERTPPRRYLSGDTFPIPEGGFEYWRITPPRGTQLEMIIPFDGRGVEMPGPHDIRSFLTGSRIRTWWAAWVLAFELEDADAFGFFNWDPRHIILDIFGAEPEYTTSKGKRYPRPNRTMERQIAKDFLFLEMCILQGVGVGDETLEVENGEALIHRYGATKLGGRPMEGGDLCAHARLAVASIKKNRFLQLPKKAFQLHADYAPLAMGLANVLRRHALGRNAWLDRGALTMPLGDLAREAGEDIAALQRKHRRQAWEYLRDKATRTIEPGGFGKVHFAGRDADERTLVTIEPSEPLCIAYRTLPDAQDRKRATDEEAAVRIAQENKRPRGRPRKMPHKKAPK